MSDAARSAAAEPLPAPICLLEAPAGEPIAWLAEGFLLDQEPTVLVGEGGVMKTTVALAIAAAVAGGYPVFGLYQVNTLGAPVLFVSEEDPLDVLQNRVEALIAGMEWDRVAVLANLHVLALGGARLDDLRWQLHLRAVAEDRGAQLVVFDPLADLLNRSDSDPDATRVGVQFWRQLTADGSAVLTVHHFGKPKDGYSRIHQVRGGGGWANGARAVYALEERDGGLWLTCEKLSRAVRPEPIELSRTIETDPENRATWLSARIEASSAKGGWTVQPRRNLTPAQRKALQAVDRHRDEVLSWSKLKDVSGLSPSGLSEALHTLIDLGYVTRISQGLDRFKKTKWAYEISGPGIAALFPEPPDTETPRETTLQTPPESTPPDTETLLPLKGGESPLAPEAESPDAAGPGLEPEEPEYREALLSEEAQ